MKKSEIKIGGEYIKTVSGSRVRVRIDKASEYGGWDATNLVTGRGIRVKSAQGLSPALSARSGLKAPRNGAETTQPLPMPPAQEPVLEPIKALPEPITPPTPSKPSLSALVGRTPTVEAPKSKYPPTPEQALILDAVKQGHRVLVVEAGAGTGKTTTLRMIGDTLPGRGQYTAFNSSLVEESKEKFQGTRVSCNTTHSLGFRAVGKEFSHRIGSNRMKSHQLALMMGIEAITVEVSDTVKKVLSPSYLAGQVMGAVKRFCQSADSEITLSHFRYIDGIDIPTELGGRPYDNNQRVREALLPFAIRAWKDLSSKDGQLPFSHDHYVKVWQLSKPVISGDYILLDEAQDTAPVMLDIIKQQTVPVIIVGDSAQQIYEWRGAVNALAQFPGAPTLYLSQSFRFGRAIAEVANAVLETLEEPTTIRLKGQESIPSKIETVAEPTAILCRTNALAVTSLLEAIKVGKRPFLIGGGGDVVSFVEAAKSLQQSVPTSHPELACFTDWKEVQEYSKLDEGEDLKLMVKLIDGFGADTILSALKGMPAREADADLVICTAHKSKGREWNSVRLTSDFPTKSKCTDSDRRLLYVAVTRAKLSLDISDCPFFTGKDSLDITEISAKYKDGTEPEPILPATPVIPRSNDTYTWGRKDGNWYVVGPGGNEGKTVEVVRKDGSKSKKTLGPTVGMVDTVRCFYRV